MRQVNICSAGECGGECYKCRLKETHKELVAYQRRYVHLYDNVTAAGVFGPWSDGWTEDDREMWDKIDDLRKELDA